MGPSWWSPGVLHPSQQWDGEGLMDQLNSLEVSACPEGQHTLPLELHCKGLHWNRLGCQQPWRHPQGQEEGYFTALSQPHGADSDTWKNSADTIQWQPALKGGKQVPYHSSRGLCRRQSVSPSRSSLRSQLTLQKPTCCCCMA